ncbi:hypothetical protein M316_0130 [Nitrincola phage 1M3-16]|uniref:hypothetical protein n=1 Tax=Nitrincola phage 1M3-16 TaxID=1472912 RepID=UPI000444B878|nr:hypothetical protein GJ22_gp022 [Nitrincola phage 1M3-16]AHX01195.1 hypothetical protein M316_0130 [Nitrincola phage 1M3-16]
MKLKKTIILFEPNDFPFEDNGFKKPTKTNPKYWEGDVRRTFDYVYAPSFPKIEAAYAAAGIKVFGAEDRPHPVKEEVVLEDTVEDNSESVTKEDFIPEVSEPLQASDKNPNWRNLPAAQLKEIAQGRVEEEVTTKKRAIEILEGLDYEG